MYRWWRSFEYNFGADLMTKSNKSKTVKQKLSLSKRKKNPRVINQGEILFYEGDLARSMYYIENGQIRLFLTKGAGTVELEVLRSGEIIGEMSYFNPEIKRRTCTAEALTTTEVYEVPFHVFDTNLRKLPMWFKTIVETLVYRLKKSNEKVKYLGGNENLLYGKDKDYQFLYDSDIAKLLAVFFLAFKIDGVYKDDVYSITDGKIQYYCKFIFNIPISKYEIFLKILLDNGIVTKEDDSGVEIISMKDINEFILMVGYFSDKKVIDCKSGGIVSDNCITILILIIDHIKTNKLEQSVVKLDISGILDEAKKKNSEISYSDLDDIIDMELCSPVIVGEDNTLNIEFQYFKIKKMLSAIKLNKSIKEINDFHKLA